MDHLSFFDVDADARHEEQKAARHASILFNQRATERFESFLRQAAHKPEFDARVELIDADLHRTASEVLGETGTESITPEVEKQVESLTAAFVERIAGGAFCDDCRKWKNGPKSLCTCGSEEGNDEGAPSDDNSAVGDKESKTMFRVVATNEDSLGGKGETAVPFNKKKHAPEVPEKSGESQDVARGADYSKEPDLGKTEDIRDGKEETGPHTDTWHGTDGQAKPVT